MFPVKLVVALGNPGDRYALTRHNAGVWFLDFFVSSSQWKTVSSLHARVCKENVLYAVPITYMNLSGQAVQSLCHYYKIDPKEVLIVHDDIDLPVGSIRLKWAGGHAGHNGLRDIITCLGTQNFWRLRIGVGRPQGVEPVDSYVLSAPSADDRFLINASLQRAFSVFPLVLSGSFEEAIQKLHSIF
ncbi:MAG: aminoacyl-tRNA hydrolase [Gammaproteobacteria bacterium]|nr:aminoacyl-tRNA hydrolase [Gammaproteobacteria bacterium]MCD8542874.1 aminoacyl-tRNA hydrolase [Gammaproteobacteria bacterium]